MVVKAVQAIRSWNRVSPVIAVALLAGACGNDAAGSGEGDPAGSGSATTTGSTTTTGTSTHGTTSSTANPTGSSSSGAGSGSAGTSSPTAGSSTNTDVETSPTGAPTNTGGTSSTQDDGDGETSAATTSNGGDSESTSTPSDAEPTSTSDGTSGEPTVTEPPGNDATQLYKKYADYFTIGAAVDSGSYQDGHAAIWKEHFNGAVAENEMKWASLQATEGTFNFNQANAMVNAARNNDMLVRGHVLVWFDQTPDWVF